MIRVAVMDDDWDITEKVAGIVREYFESVGQRHEVKIYLRPRELLWDLEQKEYFDIYFLDVELEKNMNGLDVAKDIRQLYMEPFIVFITSYIQYGVKGYEYNAYRFIIKDEFEEKLPEALEAIYQQFKSEEGKYYVIESLNGIEKIAHNNLYYLQKEGKYTYFYTRNGNTRIRKALEVVYKELDASEFIYVDKSSIVNLHHVMELRNKFIIMRGGDIVAVSIPRLKEVKRSIADFWRGKK